MVSELDILELSHIEHCSKCEDVMTPSPDLQYSNYGYICEICKTEVLLGNLVPSNDDV